jgi:hypothetical protein
MNPYPRGTYGARYMDRIRTHAKEHGNTLEQEFTLVLNKKSLLPAQLRSYFTQEVLKKLHKNE